MWHVNYVVQQRSASTTKVIMWGMVPDIANHPQFQWNWFLGFSSLKCQNLLFPTVIAMAYIPVTGCDYCTYKNKQNTEAYSKPELTYRVHDIWDKHEQTCMYFVIFLCANSHTLASVTCRCANTDVECVKYGEIPWSLSVDVMGKVSVTFRFWV